MSPLPNGEPKIDAGVGGSGASFVGFGFADLRPAGFFFAG